ncbi:MAG: ATP-binding protein [Saprospiraceae bacterium]
MATRLIGRKREIEVLKSALTSDEAEMISIIGRRRVGKTFLIQEVYKDEMVFEISGIQNADKTEQILNFRERLIEFFPNEKIETPKDWLDAFFQLVRLLREQKYDRKVVVFFDEVPWMATQKSNFLKGLSYFWNSWAVRQQIVVVLCGSAASWMINKILRDKGGLHNRVTRRIRLQPFSLAEMEAYLENRSVYFDHYQLIQLYMVMGGIPHYLKELKGGKSAAQNINQICFSEDGLLHDEFLSLYPALFQRSDYHVAIIRALATKQSGMNRNEILKTTKLPDGGRLTKVLDELNQSGFITIYPPFGKKKKGQIYRLIDEYSLFYLRFIEKNLHSLPNWTSLSQTQSYKIWCGYAYENICLKHVENIKKALEINGVYSTTSSFFKQGNKEEKGSQIDLVIDRNDHIINLCEVKFYNVEFTITKDYAQKLRDKIRVFQETTKTKKQVQLVFITTFGLKHNKHSLGLVSNDFGMNIFFNSQ